jgi:hypothetical protein
MEFKQLAFTGQFKKLKGLGYEFQKLFAMNYKCYHKAIYGYTSRLWVWVGNGGYIEFDHMYSHTANVIELLRTVDWSNVKERTTIFSDDTYKRIYMRYNHEHPENGYVITENSFTTDEIRYAKENDLNWDSDDGFEKMYNGVREKHDTEKIFTQELCEILFKEIDLIQST